MSRRRTIFGRSMRGPLKSSGTTPILQYAFSIGHRGVAVYKDSVYLTTRDTLSDCVQCQDGKIKWNVRIADSNRGYWSTNAPLVVGNHVMVGVSGDFDNLLRQLKSVDADTGETQMDLLQHHPLRCF
jgi:outer membrane protein assembly factor BamB